MSVLNISAFIMHMNGSFSPSNVSAGDADNVSQVQDFPTFKQPMHMIIIYLIAYSLVFLLGMIGNGLVVAVVYRNTRMHTVTNYFIVTLAIADILVCIIVVPITLVANIYTGWRLGAVMCKATPFLQGVAVCASVNTLTAIAVDRYLAICHPMVYKLSRKAARLIILCIWVEACAIMTPWAIYYEQNDYFSTPSQTVYVCTQAWPSKDHERGYFLGVIFLTCYTIPLVLISVCYTLISCRVWNRNAPGIANTSQVIYRSKMKVVKMLVVVVVLFAFSWLPLYAIFTRMYFGRQMDNTSLESYIVYQVVVPICQWLGASNSCVNPIIYCFFSKKFRHGFQALVTCCGKPTNYWNRSNSAYRSVCDGNGHTMYTSIRSMRAGAANTRTVLMTNSRSPTTKSEKECSNEAMTFV